jgi:manganese-dependent inorganic pyrophosphatase
MQEGSQLLVVSDNEARIEKAFDVTLEEHQVWLKGVMSRKKQIIPFLETVYA